MTWVHLLTQLLNEASFLHSAKFSHISQELIIASLVWLSVTDVQDLHGYS